MRRQGHNPPDRPDRPYTARRSSAPGRFCLASLLALLLAAFAPSASSAHPVPRKNHDRNIVVRLTADAVEVDFHLEVDAFTVVFIDLPAFSDKLDPAKLRGPRDYYEAYTRLYAPVIAQALDVRLDDRPLTLTGEPIRFREADSVQCDFRFRAPWRPEPAREHRLSFRDSSYPFPDLGQIDISVTADAPLEILSLVQAPPELKKLPYTQQRPGDEERLRVATALFRLPAEASRVRLKLAGTTLLDAPRAAYRPADRDSAASAAFARTASPGVEVAALRTGAPPVEKAAPVVVEELESPEGHFFSLQHLLDSRQGFWVLMLLATFFGAAHALTPGHGKTLVAAYLVGERGTVWHALLLGLVTTLTHTGAVLVLAAGLPLLFPAAMPEQIQSMLGLVGGLLVAGLGFWLLLKRLAGGADHIHIGGGHHHHGPADEANTEPVGWWGLVVLGISGGIVPCWDAIVMLGFAIAAQRLWLGLPLLLAFSAGLAGVLVLLGVAVVFLKGWATSKMGEGRIVRALPLFSAIAVTAIGLWLCYVSMKPASQPTAPAAPTRSISEGS